MPIERGKNVVFVHIPRTGGTSIEILLGMTGAENLWGFAPIPSWGTNCSPQHFTFQDLQRNLPDKFLSRAFKFAFVRNPWDRFVSEFEWRRRHWNSRSSSSPRVYDNRDLESLDAFTRLLRLPPDRRLDSSIGLDSHLETQTSFLIDPLGNIAVDFVGRFEKFETDLRSVLECLGIVANAIPHANGGPIRDYRAYYSRDTQEAVRRFYSDDIERFGYSF